MYNTADVLSRDISLEKFKQKLEFWICGPSWLVKATQQSKLNPDNEILLISDVYFNTSTEMMTEEPVISYERFLEYKKLCRSTIFVFKFVIKRRRLKDQPDPKHIAKSYLIKIFNLKYSIREFPT